MGGRGCGVPAEAEGATRCATFLPLQDVLQTCEQQTARAKAAEAEVPALRSSLQALEAAHAEVMLQNQLTLAQTAEMKAVLEEQESKVLALEEQQRQDRMKLRNAACRHREEVEMLRRDQAEREQVHLERLSELASAERRKGHELSEAREQYVAAEQQLSSARLREEAASRRVQELQEVEEAARQRDAHLRELESALAAARAETDAANRGLQEEQRRRAKVERYVEELGHTWRNELAVRERSQPAAVTPSAAEDIAQTWVIEGLEAELAEERAARATAEGALASLQERIREQSRRSVSVERTQECARCAVAEAQASVLRDELQRAAQTRCAREALRRPSQEGDALSTASSKGF
eukprot:Hpha_TRINITY_DN26715_c0_g1::TRINITY_DN26715_c0_g1_i2::g.138882::m.138882